MQSDSIIKLYEKLLSLTSDIESALNTGDFETVSRLTEDHRRLMSEISSSGYSDDMRIYDAVDAANKQILSVMASIKRMQEDIAAQLSASNNRRRLKTAYT